MNINELFNHQIIALSIASLGGGFHKVDTEDIAIAAYGLVPQRFCWKKYPDKIDLTIVRNALSNASKSRNGQLIRGGYGGGWMLSKKGMKWLTTISEELNTKDDSFENQKNLVVVSFETERQKLRQSRVVSKFQSGEPHNITVADFYEFVRVNEYFPRRKRHERFTTVENAVVGDKDLIDVWEYLKMTFHTELNHHE